MLFVVKNKSNKIAEIKSENFRDAMRQFVEQYDIPDASVSLKSENDIFKVISGETEIEFKYEHSAINYTFNGVNDIIFYLNKTGMKPVRPL